MVLTKHSNRFLPIRWSEAVKLSYASRRTYRNPDIVLAAFRRLKHSSNSTAKRPVGGFAAQFTIKVFRGRREPREKIDRRL
jgi:hypothetical protein